MSNATEIRPGNRRSYAPLALGLVTAFTNIGVEDGQREWFDGASASVSNPTPVFRVIKQVTIPDSPAATPAGYAPLEARVLEMALDSKVQFAMLSADVSRLAIRVDELAASLVGGEAIEDDGFVLPAQSAAIIETLGTDIAATAWASWLDAVADANANAPYITDLALNALTSTRGSVRAAAARALAVADGAIASKVLPGVIASEPNRFAASVMKSALDAVQA